MSQITWWEILGQYALSKDPPHAAGSATSKAAADSIKATAPLMRETVLAAIRSAGADGMTCDELEALLRMPHQTCSARVHELAKAEAIYDSGNRRKTRSGRAAVVYRASAKAKLRR